MDEFSRDEQIFPKGPLKTAENHEPHFDITCKTLADEVLRRLPLELRAMVYFHLHEPLEDIHIRRREVRGETTVRHYGYHTWPEVVGLKFAIEAAEDFCRRTRSIIDDADDIVKALELDVFNNNRLAKEFIRNMSVDIRTQHFGTKAQKLKPLSVYASTVNNLQYVLGIKYTSECRLNIRVLTDDMEKPWTKEVLKTLNCIRPIVRRLIGIGGQVEVVIARYASEDSAVKMEITEDFDRCDEEWRRLLGERTSLAKRILGTRM